MSRRWFTWMTGSIVGMMMVATAWAQTAQKPTSLAERMAAMRRGWTQGGTRADNNRYGEDAPASNAEKTDTSQAEPRSRWPNLFGRGETQSNARSTQSNTRQPAQASQRAAGTATTPRTASRPRTGVSQSQTAPPASVALPGLGGSPLPKAGSTSAASGSTSKPSGTDISREISGDYPVIRDESPAAGDRYRTAGTAKTGSSAANSNASRSTIKTIPSTGNAAAVRHSPSRRTVPHVDAEQLRRELAGSYPTSPSKVQPAPRVARTNNREIADSWSEQGNATKSDSDNSSEPTLADDSAALPLRDQSASGGANAADTASPSAEHQSKPALAPSVRSPSRSFGSAFSRGSSSRSPREATPPVARPSQRGQEAFGATAPIAEQIVTDPDVLVSNQTPVITTDISGPKQILVGREATYRVQLRNLGESAAEGITASIRIPSWAEVVDTTTTEGNIQQSRDANESGQLQWELTRLEGRGSETLDIRLIPRASRPLELGVSWTLTPVGSRAIVEVQEPKLQMNVSGPDQVLFNEPQIFRLSLSNPGTGMAENVKIELMPPGGGKEAATSHPIGDLQAGETRTVEVELTAREAGKLFVKAIASAEGGLTSDASKEIFCRKPELEVDWRGPETKYAGTPATYFFRVRNPGTAPAENVTVQVIMPDGAEFTSASEGQSYDAQQREVVWHIGTLNPGDDNYMELKCVVNSPGANQFQVTATAASGDLADNKTAETNVIALADLKLNVSDPSGPVAVGDEAVYEIRVQNRGANTAKEVNVVAFFSEGIEPDQVEGAMYTITDGRVEFRTIDELTAGRKLVLRIRAHAVQAGMHVFRAEVLCRDLDIKLAAEETTRFYADDMQQESDGSARQAATPSEGFGAAAQQQPEPLAR